MVEKNSAQLQPGDVIVLNPQEITAITRIQGFINAVCTQNNQQHYLVVRKDGGKVLCLFLLPKRGHGLIQEINPKHKEITAPGQNYMYGSLSSHYDLLQLKLVELPNDGRTVFFPYYKAGNRC